MEALGDEDEISGYLEWLISLSEGCIDANSLDKLVDSFLYSTLYEENLAGYGELDEIILPNKTRLVYPRQLAPSVWANIVHVYCLDDYKLKEVAGSVDVYIDAGSFIGVSVLYAATLFPRARLVAIEPNPSAYKILEYNIRLNNLAERTRLVHAALSNHTGWAELIVPLNWVNASLRKYSRLSDEEIWARIRVKSLRIRDVIRSMKGARTVLKMDVEGAETDLVKNMDGLEEDELPYITIVEAHSGRSARIVLRLLRQKGYVCSVDELDTLSQWIVRCKLNV